MVPSGRTCIGLLTLVAGAPCGMTAARHGKAQCREFSVHLGEGAVVHAGVARSHRRRG